MAMSTQQYGVGNAVVMSGAQVYGAKQGAAGAVTLIDDALTGADSTLLTAHAISPTNVPGASWSIPVGSIILRSNTATGNTDATGSIGVCNVGVVDYTLICDLGVSAAGASYSSCVARYTDTTNFWVVFVHYTNQKLYIYERTTAGGFVLRASSDMTVLIGTLYTTTVVISGASISVTSGAASASYGSMTTGLASTVCGLRLYAISPAYSIADNFKVTVP